VRYRVRAEVEAERVDRDKLHHLSPEFRAAVCHCPAVTRDICGGPYPDAHVHGPHGPVAIKDGDYIVKGVTGLFFPVAVDDFTALYEPAEKDAP
jgi:hypothetical protein